MGKQVKVKQQTTLIQRTRMFAVPMETILIFKYEEKRKEKKKYIGELLQSEKQTDQMEKELLA